MRKHGTDQLDGADEIGRYLPVDLRVADLLRCAEQAVTGVADHDVDPAQRAEAARHACPHRFGVGCVEHLDQELIAMLSRKRNLGRLKQNDYPYELA